MKPILLDSEMQHAVKHKFYVLSPDRQVAYPVAENCKDDAPVYVRQGNRWVPLEGKNKSD